VRFRQLWEFFTEDPVTQGGSSPTGELVLNLVDAWVHSRASWEVALSCSLGCQKAFLWSESRFSHRFPVLGIFHRKHQALLQATLGGVVHTHGDRQMDQVRTLIGSCVIDIPLAETEPFFLFLGLLIGSVNSSCACPKDLGPAVHGALATALPLPATIR
jgi:hypothetical protein